MRILNIIRSIDPVQGGPAEGLRQMVLANMQHGHSHEVVTLDAPGAAWLASYPVPVHALGPARGNYGYTRHLVPWLMSHGGEFDAAIVHGVWQYHGLATRHVLRRIRVPYYLFLHGMLDPWFKHAYPLKHLKKWLYWPWAEYRVVRDARAVLFTAQEESRLAPQSFWLYRAHHVVVGYGLTLDEHAAAVDDTAFHERFPATRGKRKLLFLGRIHPKKGCDLLIDAFAAVAKREPDLHLVMAGPDQVGWQRDLQARAAAAGVADRITWCGMLSGTLKWSAYRAAELFVLPSHQENFGIAVAEALATGLPVLVSDKVNIWREIVEAQAGLARPDTAAGTQDGLMRWLDLDCTERAAMQTRARACYQQHFHMASAARRMVDTISQLSSSALVASSPSMGHSQS